MNEINLYSMKEIFNFWSKCERFYGFIKKIFLLGFILNLFFWAVCISIPVIKLLFAILLVIFISADFFKRLIES